jgi:predicted nuclease of restriction endonuclease-like (RecB) superfamily
VSKDLLKKKDMESVEPPAPLLRDLRKLIANARERVARQVNEDLVTLYWMVGKRIREDVLESKRAEYGKQIVPALGRELSTEFGSGFSARNIANMIRFAEVYPDKEILHAMRTKLSWTHLRQIIYIDDPLKRDFYVEMCRIEGWSTRALENKISGMLYERTALSQKPEKLISQELESLRQEDKLTLDLVFRDPYLLGFLGLKDRYLERDLEDAIIRNIEQFILELGSGFTFVARQKRITVDNDDYYLDLLFFHRGLKRLVAIELKLGEFKPAYKGQMELYLRWLQKYDTKPGEEPPIGLILCAGKKKETIELLELEKSDIRVASYWLDVLPKELLQKKLHDAVRLARGLIEAKEPADD